MNSQDIKKSSLDLFKRIYNSSLFKSSGIYTLANVINASIPFFLLPILTRYLSTADYGIVSMFQTVLLFLYPFVSLNVDSAIGRRYYDKKEINFSQYVGNGFIISFASSTIIFIIFLIFSALLSFYTAIPRLWLLAAVAVSLCQYIINVLLIIWQVKVKPIWYGIFQILQTLMNFGLTAVLVIMLNRTWQGRLEAHIYTMLIFALLAAYILYRNNLMKLAYNRSYIIDALKYGIPLIPHTVGWMVAIIADRFFLTNLVGIEQTGIYTVAFQIGVIIRMLVSSFNTAYYPWLFERLKQNDFNVKIKIVKFTYIYFLALILLLSLFYILSPWFIKFYVGKEFYDSTNYIIWIAGGFVFYGMYLMLTNYIFYSEKTIVLGWISSSIAIINIPLTYFLIKKNNTLGAAQATLISHFLLFIFTWLAVTRVYKMPWNLKNTK